MNNGMNSQKQNSFFGTVPTEDIKNAVKNGNTAQLLSKLNDNDREMLNSLMKDKQARDKLLSSPEVKSLLSQLLGGR